MKALLISVHGKYCEMFGNQTKTIEIRKSEPKQIFNNTVYIYNTSTQQIEYKTTVFNVLRLAPSEIWKHAKKRIGIDKKTLFDYAGQKSKLVLLDFYNIEIIQKTVHIDQMRAAGITPPQGYLYINPKTLNLN